MHREPAGNVGTKRGAEIDTPDSGRDSKKARPSTNSPPLSIKSKASSVSTPAIPPNTDPSLVDAITTLVGSINKTVKEKKAAEKEIEKLTSEISRLSAKDLELQAEKKKRATVETNLREGEANIIVLKRQLATIRQSWSIFKGNARRAETEFGQELEPTELTKPRQR